MVYVSTKFSMFDDPPCKKHIMSQLFGHHNLNAICMWYLTGLTAKQNDSSLYQLMIKLIAQMVCCYSNSPFFCKDKNSNASETYTHTRYTCQNRIRWNYWLYARQEASNGLKRTDGLQDWSGGWLILQEWPAPMQPLVWPPGGAHYPSSSSAMRKDFLEMRLIGNRQQQQLAIPS